MPPWVASVPRPNLVRAGRAIDRFSSTIGCRNVPVLRTSRLRVRSATTQVSPTEVNLRPKIPPKNRELYDALSALSEVAENYVNISRLQLALRGVAAQDAVTRVAVLGLNSQAGAQRLARLLLADPLGDEQAWERKLEEPGDGEGRAVLLKYGDETDPQPPSPLYTVLPVGSRILQTHNLEILVSSLNINVASSVAPASTEDTNDSLLMPKLHAESAQALPVSFPVHKTLLFGEGLDNAVAFGKFSSGSTTEAKTVKLAINLPASSKETVQAIHDETAAIDIEVGAEALATFRRSIENAISYERGWFKSGLPTLSQWLIQDTEPSETIKPATKALISSIVSDIESSVDQVDAAQVQQLAAIPTDHQVTASIIGHLESWAEKSHTELRDELDEAFSARNWHKLSWWKLFWRVDDVAMIVSEILERRWLVSAEKSSIYLAGRMNQAGFPDDVQNIAAQDLPEVTTQETATLAEKPRTDLSTNVRTPRPWRDNISVTRTELIAETVPSLQTLAQRLILQTFSTTSLSSAFSALLYISVSSFSLSEASAVAALGLTFSLRRMQKLWEGARESWQGTVREEGRRTLKITEETARLVIRSSGKKGGVVEDEGVRERREVRDAARKVREALEKMDGNKGV